KPGLVITALTDLARCLAWHFLLQILSRHHIDAAIPSGYRMAAEPLAFGARLGVLRVAAVDAELHSTRPFDSQNRASGPQSAESWLDRAVLHGWMPLVRSPSTKSICFQTADGWPHSAAARKSPGALRMLSGAIR